MQKAIFILLAAFAGFLFFFPLGNADRTSVYVPSESVQGQRATLQIEGVSYLLSFQKSSTAYDLMEEAKKQHGILFSGREYPGLGFFVDSLNGKKENQIQSMYWVYSINGKKANVGVSSYIIQPNDVISWTYESNNQ